MANFNGNFEANSPNEKKSTQSVISRCVKLNQMNNHGFSTSVAFHFCGVYSDTIIFIFSTFWPQYFLCSFTQVYVRV